MKRKLSSVIAITAGALLVMTAVSCYLGFMNQNTTTEGSTETVTTGKISGTVQYSNIEGNNHGGIILTLDKTDGLETLAVMQTITSRSAGSARSFAPSTVSSADGSFLFENLQPGIYTVYASSPDSSQKAIFINVVVRENKTNELI